MVGIGIDIGIGIGIGRGSGSGWATHPSYAQPCCMRTLIRSDESTHAVLLCRSRTSRPHERREEEVWSEVGSKAIRPGSTGRARVSLVLQGRRYGINGNVQGH